MSDIETIDLVNSNSAYLGKIVVFTNTKGVFSIIINSKNFGKLAGMTAGNTDEYPYRLSFGTVDRIDLSSDFRMTYSVLSTDSTIDFPVSVSYDKVLDLEVPVVADTYSDIVTITFSIS